MTDTGERASASFGEVLADTVWSTLTRPYAGLVDGTPEPQRAAGRVDALVNAVGGTLAMPGALLDTVVATATSAILPRGFGMPATTIFTGLHIGIPHLHPTTLPLGVPLPGVGPAITVGALNVLIGGLPALRCGDIGMGFGCMGVPNFEVATGSSNVFIGGKRAARVFDMTRHCDPIPLLGSASGVIGSGLDALAIASMATSTVAHCVGAWSDVHDTRMTEEQGQTEAAAEVVQGTLHVAQTLADAALTPLSGLIGAIPPVGLTGDGMLTVGLPNVLVGGLPLPPLGDILNTSLHHHLRGLAHRLVHGEEGARERAPEGAPSACGRVGEPVDVVTGHVFADHLDVDHEGQTFGRHYDSRARDRVGDCGRGMRHTYERELEVWLHRCTYVDPEGVRVAFPAFRGRDRVSLGGYVLERLTEDRYVVSHRGETTTFVASPGVRAARLHSIGSASGTRTIELDGEGRFRAVRFASRALVARRDADGRIEALHDERGVARASFGYADGCLVASRDAEGGEERFGYDDARRLVWRRDGRGYAFAWRYDDAGRCVHTRGEDGQWTVDLAYEKGKTVVTHGTGLVLTVHYDAYGTVQRVVRSDGGSLLREQDACGRVVRETDAAGRTIDWLYDETGANVGRRDRFGRLLPPERDAPAETSSPFARGLPTTLAPQLGFVAGEDASSLPLAPALAPLAAWALPAPTPRREPRLERDALGRVVRAVDAGGLGTELRRDAAGNVVARVDRDHREHRAEIRGWNLVGRTIDPIGRRAEATYTTAEQVRTYRDPRGVLTEYGRDAADRLTRVTRSGRCVASYAYDAGDRLAETRDADGEVLVRIAHGADALPATITLAVGGTIALEHDARGRVTRAALGEHDARIERDEDGTVLADRVGDSGVRRWRLGPRETTSLLDRFETRVERRGDLVVVRDPSGRLSSFDARADGRVARRLANGTSEILAFDPEGRLEGRLAYRTVDGGAVAHWAVRYERSGEGDLVGLWDTARGERRFEIDAAHRLEAERDEHGVTHLFTHDAGDDVVLGGTEIDATGLLRRTRDETFEHDARGRLALRRGANGEVRYGYDSLDQLTQATLADGTRWRGSYDGLGRLRRFGREDRQTSLHWDGDRIAAEVAHDGALRVHVYADARALVPFAFVDYASVEATPESGRAYYVFHDASGMPTQIEDAAGRTVWWADRVDPYGAVTVREGAEVDYALRWPGHYFDRDLGLHHNRFRAYDPGLAHYLQPDPLGHAGSPHSLYAYAPNPLVAVDLLGLTTGCAPRPPHAAAEPSETRPVREHPRQLALGDLTPAEWRRRIAAHYALQLEIGFIGRRKAQLPGLMRAGWDPETRTLHFDADGTIEEQRALAAHPSVAEGIVYDEHGDPQLQRFVRRDGNGEAAVVAIDGFGTDRESNMAEANRVMRERDGRWGQPADVTWHELHDRRTMLAVPTAIHAACPHSGGVSRQRSVLRYGTISGYRGRNATTHVPKMSQQSRRILAKLDADAAAS